MLNVLILKMDMFITRTRKRSVFFRAVTNQLHEGSNNVISTEVVRYVDRMEIREEVINVITYQTLTNVTSIDAELSYITLLQCQK